MAAQTEDDKALVVLPDFYTEEEKAVDKYSDNEYYTEDEGEDIDWKYFDYPDPDFDKDFESGSTNNDHIQKLGCPASIGGGCYRPFPNPPQVFHYSYPKYGEYNLDWCYTWATDCGKKAADAYCRYKGHLWSSVYSKNSDIGGTKLIGTGQLCSYDWCDGFTHITCVGKN